VLICHFTLLLIIQTDVNVIYLLTGVKSAYICSVTASLDCISSRHRCVAVIACRDVTQRLVSLPPLKSWKLMRSEFLTFVNKNLHRYCNVYVGFGSGTVRILELEPSPFFLAVNWVRLLSINLSVLRWIFFQKFPREPMCKCP